MREGSPAPEGDMHAPRLNEISLKFIDECVAEKERLSEEFPIAAMLMDEAIDRVYATGRIPGREMYADVFKQKLIKVTQKVFVPVKQFPKFNFQGKILGPRGNSLRDLQSETLCRILIKGRHSMRDAAKEEELRQSNDPRHAHLSKDLYVEISTVATPAEAHARIAYALAEIRKYLIPDSNDEVSQNQRREILADPELSKRARKAFVDRAEPDKAAMSILKKISFGSSETSSLEQKPPIKRSPSEAAPYFKRRAVDDERVPGRGPISILKKVTGYSGNSATEGVGYEDEEQLRAPHQTYKSIPPSQSILNRRLETPQKRTRTDNSNEYQIGVRFNPSRSY